VSIRNVGDPIAINWKVIMEHGEFTWNGGFLGYNSVINKMFLIQN
jgi:hypothetical protein